jgi:uncharacterized coiled-coil DUF342 family protein
MPSKFFETLGTVPTLDALLHVGAGPSFAAGLYEMLPAKRYILAEADPDAAETLRREIPDSRFIVEERMLAAESGPATFRRFTLAALNGPFENGGILAVYPRLREIERLDLATMAAERFIEALDLPAHGRCALVLDLPGQEPAILRSLSPGKLQSFDFMIVRGAGEHRMKNASFHLEAHDLLLQAGFAATLEEASGDSLFPLAIFRLDRRALEIQALRQERDSLATRHQQLATERDALASEKDVLAKEREALKKEIEAGKAGAAETEKKRADLAAQLDARTKERDTLAAENKALDSRLSSLASEHSELATRHQQLATERDALISKKDTLAKERDQSRTERDALIKERDQLKKTAADRAARIAELEAQVADQAERQKLIDEQMIRAETQLEMLKEFLQPGFQ